jgi:dimethylamine corrinoid protein
MQDFHTERIVSDSTLDNLIAAILEGNSVESVSQAGQLCRCGMSSEDIVKQGIEAAMSTLDAKCTLEQFNLLEIMLAGRAVTEVIKFLYPAGTEMPCTKGTIVIATLEGDVHDLGKNIFRMVLIGNGYRVVDCGKDCPLPKLMDVTEREQPLAIGVSGLITPVIPLVRQVKDQLALRRLDRALVIAGGAALKQSMADKLNVDFVAESAFDGLHYLEEIAGGRK